MQRITLSIALSFLLLSFFLLLAQAPVVHAGASSPYRNTDTQVQPIDGPALAPTRPGADPSLVSLNLPTGNKVLIIQDQDPWGYTGIKDILTANGIGYDLVGSAQMATVDLSAYTMVIIPSVQSSGFYSAWNSNLTRFEAFVQAGGKLWLSATAYNGLSTYPLLPGGVVLNANVFDTQNTVVAPAHAWVAGVPILFSGTNASHDTFSSLYPGSVVVTQGTGGAPTLVDYRLGDGRVLISGVTLEFAWGRNPQLAYAPILQNSLLDMNLWTPILTTTTQVTSSANPSVFGQPVTFTANVTRIGGNVNEGTVAFTIDGNPACINVAVSAGVATCGPISSLAVGNHVVTASFGGTTGFKPSNDTLDDGQQINRANTTTVAVSSANPSVIGQPITFTAALSPVAPGAGTPTGTVTFSLSGAPIVGCVNLPLGTACGPFNWSVGNYPVTATYNGDGSFNSSTSPIMNQVVSCLSSAMVTNANDSGVGSLRQAIAEVCAGGTITFGGDMTITLTTGELAIGKSVTIDGTGHSVTVSGNNATRVFNASATWGTVIFNALTITQGASTGKGAGIAVQGSVTVNVSNSTFSGNSALDGGAISSFGGTLTVTRSTFSGNSALQGGAIVDTLGGTVNVADCTFSGNSATYGGAILNTTGILNVTNSTFSGNSGTDGGGSIYNSGTATVNNSIVASSLSGGNCFGSIGGSNNLASDQSCGAGFTSSSTILLGALGSYGGSTQTFPLLPGSSAIDAGDDVTCAALAGGNKDQRGMGRAGAHCDIGAFESQGFNLINPTGDGQHAPINSAFANPLGLTVSSSHGEPVSGGQVTFTAIPAANGASASITGGPATIGADGKASVTATANSLTGTYIVTAGARGAADQNFALTNDKGNTSTSVTDPTDPTVVGESYAVNFAVSPVAPATGTPTGNVTVSDGTDSCTAPVATGTCNLISTSIGAKTLTATYAGDSNLNGSIGTTSHTVSQATPTLSTDASGPVTLGRSINDVAHLVGGYNLTGNLTFSVYGPNDAQCATPLNTGLSPVTVNGPGDYASGDFTPAVHGDYRWRASYSGDTNNNGVNTPCNDANETSTVTFVPITISGLKFNDLNGDGSQEVGEPALAGWTIQLRDASENLLAITVTDANGAYSFSNVGPGTYRVREVQQDGWLQMTADPADITAVSGVDVRNVNFGNVYPANVSLTKTAATNPIAAGAVETYTLTVVNAGPNAAANVVLRDPLPAGTTFRSLTLTPSTGWTCTKPLVGATGTVTCRKDTLTSGETASFSVAVKVNPALAVGTLKNTATVSSTVFDPDTSNNTATVETDVVTSADLSLTMVRTNVTGGVLYTLRVKNTGPSVAQEVVVRDGLPGTTRLQSARTTKGKCGGGPNVECRLGSLQPGQVVTIKLKVLVPRSALEENSATVESTTPDPNLKNNAASLPGAMSQVLQGIGLAAALPDWRITQLE